MNYQKILEKNNVEVCVNIKWYNEKSPAVIICPGLNLSKSGPFFLLSNIARRCHEEGMNVFQFDYYGDGDSSGSYKDVSLYLITHTVEMVKEFAEELGCCEFIYIGYGIGNFLASHFGNLEDTIGVCCITPFFYAHTKVEEIMSMALNDKSENMFLDKYLWPVTDTEIQMKYWCSLIGIVSWLYYTPVNADLLYELADLDLVENIEANKGKVLIISQQEDIQTDIVNRNGNIEFADINGLHPRNKDEWEKYKDWPLKWDEIVLSISDWIKRNFNVNGIDYQNNNKLDLENQKAVEIQQVIKKHSITYISEEKWLFGILQVPPLKLKKENRKFPCVIYEPGLGGSRVDMSRVGPWLGEYLADRGYAFFSYDSAGSGVSDGEFYEVTWEKRLIDLKNAIDELGKIDFIDTDNIAIVSYSAGSKLACLAANRIPQIKGCVLWSPHFFENSQQNREKVKFITNDRKKLVCPLSGLWLGYDYFRCEKKNDFLNEFETSVKQIKVITGDQTELDENIEYVEKVCNSSINKEVIKYPGSHCFLYKYMEPIIADTAVLMESFFEK
jgi:pimeloyl-ACP methyl ester carboxylesterase